MLTKLLFGESGAHKGERSLLLLTPCYFVLTYTIHGCRNYLRQYVYDFVECYISVPHL